MRMLATAIASTLLASSAFAEMPSWLDRIYYNTWECKALNFTRTYTFKGKNEYVNVRESPRYDLYEYSYMPQYSYYRGGFVRLDGSPMSTTGMRELESITITESQFTANYSYWQGTYPGHCQEHVSEDVLCHPVGTEPEASEPLDP